MSASLFDLTIRPDLVTWWWLRWAETLAGESEAIECAKHEQACSDIDAEIARGKTWLCSSYPEPTPHTWSRLRQGGRASLECPSTLD